MKDFLLGFGKSFSRSFLAEYVKGYAPQIACDPELGHAHNCPGNNVCWVDRIIGVPIEDMHAGNVIITGEGMIYIIDLGHGSTDEALDRTR